MIASLVECCVRDTRLHIYMCDLDTPHKPVNYASCRGRIQSQDDLGHKSELLNDRNYALFIPELCQALKYL